MTMAVTRRVCVVAGLVAAFLASAGILPAQTLPGMAGAAAQAPPAKDPLERETPRGTVIGFIATARQGNNDVAALYLDTDLKGEAAADLARKLYVVLDARLPARLNELSDRPEGAATNPLRPDENIVGAISVTSGSFDVLVDRIARGGTPPVWLFSRRTLASIPEAYEEVDRVVVDRFIPGFLGKPRIFGVRLFAWLVLLIGGPLCYRLLGLLTRPLAPLVSLWHRRSGGTGTVLERRVPGVVRLVIMAIAVRWLLVYLELPLLERQFWSGVSTLLLVAATGSCLLLFNTYGERYLLRQFVGSGDLGSLLRLARRVADVLVVVACGVAMLRYFGFDPTAALAGLGIGGIAVALAAQKTLENVIAGLSLIFDKAVEVGDAIKFGDTTGTVDYIGLRSTRIRTLDRTMLSVPNSQIASVSIESLSIRDKFWFHHFIGLRYETSAEQIKVVIEGIRRALTSHPSIDSQSVRVRFLRIGAFSLDIEIGAYVLTRDGERFLDLQQDLLLRIMAVIADAGTAIAMPSQTLHIADSRTPNPLAAASSLRATT